MAGLSWATRASLLPVKGSVNLAELCRDVPVELLYYAYVRQLKYDQEPDYEYLRDCLDFGKLNFGQIAKSPDGTACITTNPSSGSESRAQAIAYRRPWKK